MRPQMRVTTQVVETSGLTAAAGGYIVAGAGVTWFESVVEGVLWSAWRGPCSA